MPANQQSQSRYMACYECPFWKKTKTKTVIWKPHTQIYNTINHMHMFYLKIIRWCLTQTETKAIPHNVAFNNVIKFLIGTWALWVSPEMCHAGIHQFCKPGWLPPGSIPRFTTKQSINVVKTHCCWYLQLVVYLEKKTNKKITPALFGSHFAQWAQGTLYISQRNLKLTPVLCIFISNSSGNKIGSLATFTYNFAVFFLTPP